MKTELIPCPLCKRQEASTEMMVEGEYWVRCQECSAQTNGFPTVEGAVDAWNSGDVEAFEPE
jgi:hypothetical protein